MQFNLQDSLFFNFYRFLSSFLFICITHTFPLSFYFSHFTVFFLSILLVWYGLLFSVTSLLPFPLSKRVREQKMTKRNDLNDSGNSAHKPTQLVYVPEGLCDGTFNLLTIPSVGYLCYSCSWSVNPHGTESMCILLHWVHFSYNMTPNASQLFPQGPISKTAIHFKTGEKSEMEYSLLSGKGFERVILTMCEFHVTLIPVYIIPL